MNKAYEFIEIVPRLYLIKWSRTPNYKEEMLFIEELRQLLNNADDSLYFISDVRKGRLISSQSIGQLVRLTDHDSWAGSTAYSENSISNLFVKQFHRSLGENKDKNSMFDYAEEAVAFIQKLAPDLTKDVEWVDFIPHIKLTEESS